MFTEILHIRPWETELLTLGEFHALCAYVQDQQDKAEEQMAKMEA